MRTLRSLEFSSRFLSDLKRFADEDPENNYDIVAQEVLKDNGERDLIAPVRLAAISKLSGYFKSNPNELKALLDLDMEGKLVLLQVSSFIQENPEAHQRIVLEELERTKEEGAFDGQFSHGRLRALSSPTIQQRGLGLLRS